MTPTSQATKEKIHKPAFKIKNFCTPKHTIKRVKKPREREKNICKLY